MRSASLYQKQHYGGVTEMRPTKSQKFRKDITYSVLQNLKPKTGVVSSKLKAHVFYAT